MHHAVSQETIFREPSLPLQPGSFPPAFQNGAAPSAFTLAVMEADREPYLFAPEPGTQAFSFGRTEAEGLTLTSRLVSRSHGTFAWRAGRWTLTVFPHVTNPLTVNGHPVGNTPVLLTHCDVIRIDYPNEVHTLGVQMVFLQANHTDHVDGPLKCAVSMTRIPLDGRDTLTIGRDPDCAVRIPHVSVSRKHAFLRREEGGGHLLIDNKSTNGLSVNHSPVQGRCKLRRRDVIAVADTLILYAPEQLWVLRPPDGVALEARGLTKRVRHKGRYKTILDDASFRVAPGALTAIIGGSGAGKSTLLHCLSGFSMASAGSVSLNGQSLAQGYVVLQSMIGFVPQQDIVHEDLLLGTMLGYAAKQRMPQDASAIERTARVEEVLTLLDISAHRHTQIARLSGGQRKRASIAVEMLSDPNLFFLDEPTSGLDPGSERALMRALKVLSERGKTIVIVTHTTQSLDLCDQVIVMGAGGRVLSSFGPEETLAFFGARDMTEVYEIAARDADTLAARYRETTPPSDIQAKSPADVAAPRSRRAHGTFHAGAQYRLQSVRSLDVLRNQRGKVVLMIAQAPILGLIVAAVSSSETFVTWVDTRTVLFTMAIAAIWMGLLCAVGEISKEKAILRRERMAGLSPAAYLLSKLTVLALLAGVQSTLFTGTFFLVSGYTPATHVLTSSTAVDILLTLFITEIAATTMGLMISALAPTSDAATALVPYALMPQLVFAGVLFDMNGHLSALQGLVFSHWAMNALGASGHLNEIEMRIIGAIGWRPPTEMFSAYTAEPARVLAAWGAMLLIALVCLGACYWKVHAAGTPVK